MLVDDVRAALPNLRAEAEALMVDHCVITRGGSSVFDENTGRYTTSGGTDVYEGPCRVFTGGGGARRADVASLEAILSTPTLCLPWGSAAVKVGDRCVIDVTDDLALLDRPTAVAAVRVESIQVEQRVTLEDVR